MQQQLLMLLTLLWVHVPMSAQSVIINEMSQGSDGGKEWVELLIIDDGVDMRSWELGDNDDGTWHSIAQFTNHSSLSNIASGTIIVIFNSGDIDGTITSAGGEDTTFADKSVILGVNNITFLEDTGPWGGSSGAFANSDGDDTPAIRDAGDIIVHDMAVTHATATVPTPGSGKAKYYTGNTVTGISDDSNWTVASSSSGTPGQANGGDNSNWVDQSLPVELSQWFAHSENGVVILNWVTESEFENQGFILERALRQHFDGLSVTARGSNSGWVEISSFTSNPDLLGQGSTSSQTDYTFTDREVEVGKTYSYRLSDVDYRGNVTSHNEAIVSVLDVGENQGYSITTFPNPSNSGIHLVIGNENEIQPLQVDILNLKGELVKNLFSATPVTNILNVWWDGTGSELMPVSSGTYIVNISGKKVSYSKAVTIIQ
jgi:hypothetical protein